MIFRELIELEKQYRKGTIPEPEDLSGEYYVVAPCFPWVSFKALRHRKAIEVGGNGDNVLLKGFRFGRFNLEKQEEALLIDYDLPGNSIAMRRVVDKLRKLPDGRIVGKLYYRVLGRQLFLMFFEMIRREEG